RAHRAGQFHGDRRRSRIRRRRGKRRSGHARAGYHERCDLHCAAGRYGRYARGGDVVGELKPIRVVIADDQAMLRGSLAALLDLEDDLAVVGVAGDGEAALELVRQTAPDVCLMDIQMPGMDGIAATQAIRAANAATSVLIVTTFARPGYLR